MPPMLPLFGDHNKHTEYTSAKMWNASEETNTQTPLADNTTNATTIYLFPWGSLVSLNYNLPTLIIVAVVLFIVIVATAFGNFLVVLALFKYRSLRTISNYLIGNLALSDFLLATTILPLSTFNECLGHWIFGKALCNAWLIMDVLYCTASIWNILVIAFDRFTATLYPIWYREKRSAKKAAVYIALVWLISCAICLPPVLGWNDLAQNYINDRNQGLYMCVLFQTPSYVLYSASGSFYIPFFMTFFFYLGIFIALRGRMKKTRRAAMKAKAAHNPSYGAGDHLQPPSKKTGTATGAAAHKKPKKKATRLEKEYKLELVSIDDKKEGIVADENSSKSLFGSDSDREKSVSDVEIDVGSVCPNVEISETVSTLVSYAGGGGGVSSGQESIPSNGFSRVPSAALQRPATAAEGNSEPRKQGSTVETCRLGTTTGTGVAAGHANHNKQRLTPCLASATPAAKASHPKPVVPSKAHPGMITACILADKKGPVVASTKAPVTRATKQHRRYEQREMRATIRMAIIIAFFCGMWVGFFTLYVINGWCTGCYISRELEAFFFWLGYSNSSINPILYTIFNDDFRKAFMQIVGCHVGRKVKR